MKTVVRLLLATLIAFSGYADSAAQWPGIYLEPMTIAGFPGIQSYAYGTHNGKWLIIGGRIDGLHRRQPVFSFDEAGNNKNIYVVDPVTGMSWNAPLAGLPAALCEQLSSTNMAFHQRDTTLYCIGGYGYSPTAGDHITYNYLTAVNIPELINAIISGTDISSYFRQISEPEFAVTGGHLERIYDLFYLVGGNKFTGRYNPMGGPSYTQEYTNQIRKMKIDDDGTTITVTQYPAITDAAHLHRRDYNLIPQIMPDGKEGLTAFSGVFQATADIPYLDCVNVDSSGYEISSTFSQYYNHYHCANMALYSHAANEMHSFFFGGIAQYFDSAGILVQDNNVPFVKTIARVVRNSSGEMTEYKLPVEMPALLGASAELILADGLPTYPNRVINADDITADTTLAGYIVGGINSTAPNIFFINTGTESSASASIYKVYLVKNGTNGVEHINPQSRGGLHLQLYPNPSEGTVYVKFELKTATSVLITMTSNDGRQVIRDTRTLPSGPHTLRYDIGRSGRPSTNILFITLQTPEQSSTQKLILSD